MKHTSETGMEDAAELRRQRDDLLAAVEFFVDAYEEMAWIDEAKFSEWRALIAKTKGEIER